MPPRPILPILLHRHSLSRPGVPDNRYTRIKNKTKLNENKHLPACLAAPRLSQVQNVALLQIVAQRVKQLQLLLRLQCEDLRQQLLRRHRPNEARDVHVDEGGHQELTVEAVHNPTMSRDHVAKVLDLERALKAGRKEAAEWADDGAEEAQRQRVQHEGVHGDGAVQPRDRVLLRHKQVVGLAGHTDLVRALVVANRADKVAELAEEVGEDEAKDHGGEAAAHEALPGLLGAELDQRRLAEEEAKHVGHDVVADNHGDGHDEPDHALEDVLDDEVALRDDNQQGDVRPGEERELAHVVLAGEREHEPDEADAVEGEGEEAVVLDEQPQPLDLVDKVAKVVDEVLAVEEVVGGEEEVPGEAAEPRQAVDAVHRVADRDDLLEALHLHEEGLRAGRRNGE